MDENLIPSEIAYFMPLNGKGSAKAILDTPYSSIEFEKDNENDNIVYLICKTAPIYNEIVTYKFDINSFNIEEIYSSSHEKSNKESVPQVAKSELLNIVESYDKQKKLIMENLIESELRDRWYEKYYLEDNSGNVNEIKQLANPDYANDKDKEIHEFFFKLV